jgi:hypothetical protein
VTQIFGASESCVDAVSASCFCTSRVHAAYIVHTPVEKTSPRACHCLSPHPPLPLHIHDWAVANAMGHHIVEQSRGHHAMSCHPPTMLDMPPFSARRSPHYAPTSYLVVDSRTPEHIEPKSQDMHAPFGNLAAVKLWDRLGVRTEHHGPLFFPWPPSFQATFSLDLTPLRATPCVIELLISSQRQ